MKFVDTTQLSLECFTMQMPAHSTAEADANSNTVTKPQAKQLMEQVIQGV